MKPEHKEATENYFKARGFEYLDLPEYDVNQWVAPDDSRYQSLPNICESMTDWIKYVAEPMEGEGFVSGIIPGIYMLPVFSWGDGDSNYWNKKIKDNEILLASVEAATLYWESKNVS
jgi:hypothetical protein